MLAVHAPAAYEELVNYLAERASPQEILEFQVSETAQARAELLLEHNSAGTLTPEESMELAQMVYFDGLVSVLKAAALERLGIDVSCNYSLDDLLAQVTPENLHGEIDWK